jgi:aspartate racemase
MSTPLSFGGKTRKNIGLLGGTNWISTIDYYRTLNDIVARKTNAQQAPQILLWSTNYPQIKKHYRTDWSLAKKAFEEELRAFLDCRPASLLICNHTLHKAFDEIRKDLKFEIPIFHSLELTIREARRLKYKNLLVLGTEFLMQDGYWVEKFRATGLSAKCAAQNDWKLIQTAQTAVAESRPTAELRNAIGDLLLEYQGFDAVVLACTELPSIIDLSNCKLPILNPLVLQCREATDWYLNR